MRMLIGLMRMLPKISHLQFLVLGCLGSSELNGRQLRKCMAEEGTTMSGPSFYQMMGRLEKSKFVEGWYNQKTIEGQIIRERHYRITGKGISAFKATLCFYNRPQPHTPHENENCN
jgi:DNA-binding PadR family transcriptional regulator